MNPILPVQNVLLLIGALAALAGVLSWRSTGVCRRPVRLGIACLRVAGVAMLALPLLNPGSWVVPPAKSDAEWAVLLDHSASMSTADTDASSRLATARSLAESVTQLAESRGHALSLHTFDGPGIRSSPDTTPVSDTPTDIPGAVAALLTRYSAGSPSLEGILVLSDGRQVAATPLDTALLPARSTETPVFALAVGGPVVEPDLKIRPGRRQYTLFKGQELRVNAIISAANAPNRSTEVQLVDPSGSVREKRSLRLANDGETEVPFSLKDLPVGYHEFWVEAGAMENEKDPTNNRARFGVQVLDETIRVLLVEGNPYWDTKFIAQLLQREPNHAFELVYRLSAERFFSLATDDGDGNLAMVHRAAFPAEAAELSRYDLIILGRSVEGFLGEGRAALLAEWVKHGGALVLARGNPVTTTVPALEPLYPMNWDTPVSAEFRWRPTTTGEEAGLFGTDLPGRSAPLWNKLPPLREAQTGSELKPFAQVLVEGVTFQGSREARFPLVVSRRFGEGRVVSVNGNDLWRWDFFPGVPEASDLYRDFWLQLLNWIVSYSDFLPGHNFALRVSHQTSEVGKPVRVRVLRRPGTAPSAAPHLVVSRDGHPVSTFEPLVNPANPDQWDAVFPLEEPGLHTIQLQSGEDSGPLHATLLVRAPPGEMSELSADPEYLRALAEPTGGRLLTPDTLAALFDRPAPLPQTTDGVAEWKSSWDTWMWLLPMLGFFAAEWVLRRRNGLI